MKHVVIAGGSGFLGTSLAAHLADDNFRVTVLSRKPVESFAQSGNAWAFARWDARNLEDWISVLNQADAVVNLVGRSVDCIKTPEHCDEILRSRIESTRVLGQAMRAVDSPPKVWVQMSTAHIYGDPAEIICTEDSPFGYGLAPDVGRAWEQEFANSIHPDQRGVVLRASFVIGRERGAGGGALARLRFVTRLGIGGKIGSGRQGMSWIHEEDLNRIVEASILNSSFQGPYIASSPNPVSQREFMRTLRSVQRIPIGLPATAGMVRFGAKWLLRTDPDLALYGRFVEPKRLIESGFAFEFPELRSALADLV